MARARNIKPAFFQNEELAELEPIERLAFIGLWTIADYKGCLEYRSKRLKIQILPYDNCNIELIVNNLNRYGFIRIYSVQEQQYIKIINFEKHQNPHKNERESGSDIPDYEESNNEIIDLSKDGINTDKIGTNRADSLLLIPDSFNPIYENFSSKNYSDDFEEFWKNYPKKTGKDAAYKSWKKLKPRIDDVLFAISWQKDLKSWRDGFIKNPSTYLNQGCWKDEPPEQFTGDPF